MTLFSPQVVYCNACGRRMFKPIPNLIGREFKVCSVECARRYQAAAARSILGVPDLDAPLEPPPAPDWKGDPK